MTHPLSTQKWKNLRRQVIATASVCSAPDCGLPLHPELRWPDPLSTVVDHVVARANGGATFDPTNLRAMHKRCNERKGMGPPATPQVPPTTRHW